MGVWYTLSYTVVCCVPDTFVFLNPHLASKLLVCWYFSKFLEFYFHFKTKIYELGSRNLFQTRFCFDNLNRLVGPNSKPTHNLAFANTLRLVLSALTWARKSVLVYVFSDNEYKLDLQNNKYKLDSSTQSN